MSGRKTVYVFGCSACHRESRFNREPIEIPPCPKCHREGTLYYIRKE